jgi:hypothetical protein
MREPGTFVRCNTVIYGPHDFDDVGAAFGMSPVDAREFSARRFLELHDASSPPILVVKAGRERNAGINESIDRFAAAAAQRGARVQVLSHATGIHAFDVLQPGARSRALIRRALAFMKGRLGAPTFAAARRPPPLRLQTCVTRAERRRVVWLSRPVPRPPVQGVISFASPTSFGVERDRTGGLRRDRRGGARRGRPRRLRGSGTSNERLGIRNISVLTAAPKFGTNGSTSTFDNLKDVLTNLPAANAPSFGQDCFHSRTPTRWRT